MSNLIRVKDVASKLIDFINKSPSPFHAVDECKKQLVGAGFQELHEAECWKIEPNKKYFLTRNRSTLAAFVVGGNYLAGNGVAIIAAHTDSPCLKIKPVSKRDKLNYLQVAVECYGGGIWRTWFDRDLSMAGRLIAKDADGGLRQHLVHVKEPLLSIPNLCIHLTKERTTFSPNLETELLPILATEAAAQLMNVTVDTQKPGSEQSSKHHSLLVKAVCDEAGVNPGDLVDMELILGDSQPAGFVGPLKEFIAAPRTDNLVSCFLATRALIESCESDVSADSIIRMITLYDNEEVGSQSAQGAGSLFTELVLRRLSVSQSEPCAFERGMRRSFLLSADMAHAVHPNYADKHAENLQPRLHKGPVLKYNANQRYVTNSVTTAYIRMCAQQADVPLQDFAIRNDSACGSTIGPILAAGLGMQTLDLGLPSLAMHSIRETIGTFDLVYGIDLFKTFFTSYSSHLQNSDLLD